MGGSRVRVSVVLGCREPPADQSSSSLAIPPVDDTVGCSSSGGSRLPYTDRSTRLTHAEPVKAPNQASEN